MRLVALLAVVGIIVLVLWAAFAPGSDAGDSSRPVEPSADPLSAATATDPYIRSIQGAQEARSRMEAQGAHVDAELGK